MKQFLSELKSFPKKCDWVLLLLCLTTSGLGTVIVASATSANKFGGSVRYMAVQIGATLIGLLLFAIVSSIDVEIMSEHRHLLVLFNTILLLMLMAVYAPQWKAAWKARKEKKDHLR